MYIWPDGRRFEGEFLQGKQHGIGIFISKNGQRREAEFKNGKRIRWLDNEEGGDDYEDEEDEVDVKVRMRDDYD